MWPYKFVAIFQSEQRRPRALQAAAGHNCQQSGRTQWTCPDRCLSVDCDAHSFRLRWNTPCGPANARHVKDKSQADRKRTHQKEIKANAAVLADCVRKAGQQRG
jgi:hypothetical protein